MPCGGPRSYGNYNTTDCGAAGLPDYCGQSAIVDKKSGMFAIGNSSWGHFTRVRDITDGLSQTFMVGERSRKLAPGTWVGLVTGGQHAPARIVGIAAFPPNSEQEEEHYFHNFSSRHPSGTHFLSADGSVRLITETIDQQLYHALCTREGGEVVGEY